MVGVSGRSGGNRSIGGGDPLKADGGPIKPKLPEDIGSKWDLLIDQLPTGSLRRIDSHELKILAELLVMADSLSEAIREAPSDHKASRIYLNVVAQIHRLSASFGLNPADRKRLAITPVDDQPDEFAELLKRRGVMPL